MLNIRQFCEKRNISKNIEDAFVTYCRSLYATRFELKPSGDTLTGILKKLNDREIERLWMDFVCEFQQILPSD